MHQQLSWWTTNEKNISYYFGTIVQKLEIFSDASFEGWGGFNGKEKAGGRWSELEKGNSINWLELKAAFLTMKTFARGLTNCGITVNIDNTCAISYIQKQGGVIQSLDLLANEIWLWCKEKNLWLKARHIPGSKI